MSKRNENRTGYKKTKVGWIPEEWKCVMLKDIAIINPSKDKMNDGEKLVSFLPMSALTEEGKVISKQTRKYKEVSNGFTYFKEGDILVAKITPCFENGKGALVDNLLNGIGFGSTEFHVIRPIKANREYIFYITRTSSFRRKGESNMTGSAGQRRVPADFIKSYRIPLPPLPEQKKIAEILTTWDKAIKLLVRLIDAKQRLKKGLMQQLLTGKQRFKKFKGTPWKKEMLGSYFQEFSEKNTDGREQQILSCTKTKGIVSQEERFGKRLASKDLTNYKIVKKGDLVYDPMLLWDASIGFLKRYESGVVSPAYCTFKFDESKGDRDYFEVLFDTHYLKHQYRVISQGTNVRRRKAPAKAFLQIVVKMPSTIEEQKKIADVFRTLNQEIQLLEQYLERLQVQKKGLMQKLLTGEIRVKVKGKGVK